jgi:hypothetical protein
MFSRGGLYGRFVSVPIMRCEAVRCDNAEMTCVELKAGFKGTYNCQPIQHAVESRQRKVYQYSTKFK